MISGALRHLRVSRLICRRSNESALRNERPATLRVDPISRGSCKKNPKEPFYGHSLCLLACE